MISFMEHELIKLCRKQNIDLQEILKNKNNYYHTFYIRKRDGKQRPINAPFGSLIIVQKICVSYLSDKANLIHPKARAFRRGLSLKHNALPHTGQNKLLKIDLKNFFSTITYNHIKEKLDDLIAELTTLNGIVPQGAPTSPIISNIIAYDMDCKMNEWATKHGLSYTRYADDMAFSGSKIPIDYKKALHSIVTSSGFVMNRRKTRLISNNREQCVTGVTVNKKSPSISKRRCRHKLRAILHYYGKNRTELTDEIKGLLAYIKSVNKSQYSKLVGDYEQQKQRQR